MMIVYHTAFDLAFFYGWNISVLRGGWWLLARATAVLFLVLSGLASAISWKRHSGLGMQLPRVIRILSGALVVTVVTRVLFSSLYVRFGILHLIGTGALLLPLYARMRTGVILLFGFAVLLAALILPAGSVGSALLIPIGFPPKQYASLDYFPLLPWFGVILFGFTLGRSLYGGGGVLEYPSDGSSMPRGGRRSVTLLLYLCAWPGRHSLLIYLLHQPLILLVLTLLLDTSHL